MNEQRRFVLKALGVSGVSIAAYGGYTYLYSHKEHDIENWFKQLTLDPSLSILRDQYTAPVDQLLTHLNAKKKISFKDLEEKVLASISQDFTLGKIVKVDQWHISLTEALIIASAFDVLGVVAETKVIKTYDNAPFEDFLTVEKWGPQETYQGIKFNEQPDGHCGLWVVATGVSDALQIYVAGKKRNVFVNEKGLTTGIYKDVDSFINTIGTSQIIAYDEINHVKQVIGEFKVLPPPKFHQYDDGSSSKVFSEIRKWGPKNALVGEVFNIQPNGYAAFWIKGSSRSKSVKLRFNNKEHTTTVRKDMITTSFSPLNLPSKPGKYPVSLVSHEHDEELLLGFMEVR